MAETHSWLIPLRGCELPSPNSKNMGSAFKRRDIIRDVRELARMQSLSERNRLGLPEAAEHRVVTLTRLMGKGQRAMDGDNLQAMLKPARDSLQNTTAKHPGSGWIVKDDAQWATVTYDQVKDARGPAVEVTISEP